MNDLNLDSELISCPICSVKYSLNNNLPYSISCGHTYCNACLDKIKKDSSIVCPIDKKKISIYGGLNSYKSISQNLDLTKFLILIKFTQKIDLSVFHSHSFEFCDDCSIYLSSSLKTKHMLMGHNFLNLHQIYSKYVSKDANKMTENENIKYYLIMLFFCQENFSFINFLNYKILEYMINKDYYFVSLKPKENQKSLIYDIFNIQIEKITTIKYGFYYKDKTKIFGIFQFDENNLIVDIFGIMVKKLKNKNKKYFYGYMNINHDDKQKSIIFNMGLYFNDNNLMFGKFFSEDNTQLLYGEINNLLKNEIHTIPLNYTNENKFNINDNKIRIEQSVFKVEKETEIVEEKFCLIYSFEDNLLKEILIEKINLTNEPYAKIEIPPGNIENITLKDAKIEYYCGKRQVALILFEKEIIILHSNKFGYIIKKQENNNPDLTSYLTSINELKDLNLQGFGQNFSNFCINFSRILQEKLCNFNIKYKYFIDLKDLEIDYSKDNFYFDSSLNTVISKDKISEYKFDFNFNNQVVLDLINDPYKHIQAVNNLLCKQKNIPLKSYNTRESVLEKEKQKDKIHCNCQVF